MKLCIVEDCGRDTSKGSQGYCGMHWLRLTRYGRLHSIVNRGSGRTITSAGYVLLQMADGSRQYEHVVVAQQALGKPLPQGAVVHHMNRDPSDNHTPFNLVICPDQAYHLLLHQRMREAETIKRDD